MKTIKTRLFFVLWCMLIPLLTANCSGKKTAEKAGETETTAKTESVIQVSTPPFLKFIVVTLEKAELYKNANTNSPTLVEWYEADCESDFCEVVFQWSDQPGKPGFESSEETIACEGRVFPVLGEEGNFYKVSTTTKWCDVESAYIPKDCVGDIENAPIKADALEADDNYFKCRVVKDGKYKDIVLIDEYNELEGEYINVGVLNDGVVATPLVYHIYSYQVNDQKEDIIIDNTEDEITLKYSKSMALPAEDGGESCQIDLKKLSDEQITKIVDTMIKKKPEYVDYMYHFPAKGLESFIYKSK